MAKYLVEATYTHEGVQGVAREGGTSRVKTVGASIESAGGRLESFYYALGESDAILIVDLPDNVAAAALAIAVNGAGGATIRTTPLLTPAEVDEATRRSVSYRAPGT